MKAKAEQRKPRRRGAKEGWDKAMKSMVDEIALLSTRVGPWDGDVWRRWLKEEYRTLIAYT